jgi:hypothetical protein
MEDDFLAWKPKIMESISKYFGIEDLGGKANREAPHVPLYKLLYMDDAKPATVFHGELTGDGKPRRFKTIEAEDGSVKFAEDR